MEEVVDEEEEVGRGRGSPFDVLVVFDCSIVHDKSFHLGERIPPFFPSPKPHLHIISSPTPQLLFGKHFP